MQHSPAASVISAPAPKPSKPPRQRQKRKRKSKAALQQSTRRTAATQASQAFCPNFQRANTMPLMTMTPKAMQRKPSIRGRAWRLLRLAVLWARTGSAVQSLRLLKTLRRTRGIGLGLRGGRRNDRLRYGEREFSIDETPAFRFRTPSARVLRFIPCIAPAVPDTPAGGFYGDDDRYFFRGREDCCYDDGEPSECGGGGVESLDDDGADDDEQLLERALMEASSCSSFGAAEGGGDAGVDVKADEFIARFYAQMKLQRQISWLQYTEMMERGVC